MPSTEPGWSAGVPRQPRSESRRDGGALHYARYVCSQDDFFPTHRMNAVRSSSNADGTEPQLSTWISWSVLLAGFGAIVASAYIVITAYSPLPHWDEWALFDHLA